MFGPGIWEGSCGHKQVRAGKGQFSCNLGKTDLIADLKANFQVLFFFREIGSIELPFEK